MDTKIALLIIYNHRYDKNISRINQIYLGRFEHIYHIMPFYDGELENVIPVYDNSFQFQGYICQAYQHLKDKGFTHFVAVADDMVINPALNASNFFELTGIDYNSCFIHELNDSVTVNKKWWHTKDIIRFSVFHRGSELDNILPTTEQAIKAFSEHGYKTRLVPEWPYSNVKRSIKEFLLLIRRMIWYRIFGQVYYRYPLMGGYSDMIVVPAEIMPHFCQYCGAFTAARLFVEVAIPTAMVLCSPKIQTIANIKMNKSLLLPRDNNKNFLPACEFSYKKLVELFPADMLYIHPVKLSKWK